MEKTMKKSKDLYRHLMYNTEQNNYMWVSSESRDKKYYFVEREPIFCMQCGLMTLNTGTFKMEKEKVSVMRDLGLLTKDSKPFSKVAMDYSDCKGDWEEHAESIIEVIE